MFKTSRCSYKSLTNEGVSPSITAVTSYNRLSLLSSVPVEGFLTCPEHFPAVQVVEAGEEESKSCGVGSDGQGCEQEPSLAI